MDNTINTDYIQIINNRFNSFIDRVSKYRADSIDEETTFGLFNFPKKELFEYYLYSGKIECLFMEELVFGILEEFSQIFKKRYKRENSKNINFSITKFDDYKTVYDFAFRIDDIGYTFFKKDIKNKAKIIKEYQLTDLIMISFSKNANSFSVSFETFLLKYFPSYATTAYLTYMNLALSLADSLSGRKVINVLTNQNAINFKKQLLEELSIFDLNCKKYYYVKDVKTRSLGTYQLDEENLMLVKNNLLKNKSLELLIGNNNFSKCFITSEYIFTELKRQKTFDYTSMVCGYLKSVESLLNFYHLSSGIEDSFFFRKNIKSFEEKNEKNDKKYIINKINDNLYAIKEEKSKKPIQFNDSIERFELDDRYWLLNSNGKKVIINMLNDFRRTCRNQNLHLDYIYNYDEVFRIRNNAIICLLYILGGCRFIDPKLIDLIPFKSEYNDLYNCYQSIHPGTAMFRVKIDNKVFLCKKSITAHKIKYDDNLIIQTPIVLIVVNNFEETVSLREEDYDESQLLVLSANNMPESMDLLNEDNSVKQKII